MPRLFIALDLPPAARDALAALAGGIPGARWVASDQLHLTLRFLGSVADDQVPALQQALAPVRTDPFPIAVAGVGTFPPAPTRRKPARVLWAGLAPVEPVRALKEAIDAALGPDPEMGDHPFSPHVTLARFKEPPPAAALSSFLERHRALAGAPFPVTSFQLYESRTLREGPVYTVRASYALTV
jgi:2'-5' RNA ligase